MAQPSSPSRVPVVLSVLALVLALVAAGLAFRPALSAPASGDRTINVLAVEYKGTAGPGERVPEGTKVNAYSWDPSTIIVNKGDHVILKIYGVNGGSHPSTIEGYSSLTYTVKDVNGTQVESGTGTFLVYRGHTTEVQFTASIAGTFKFACGTHQPTMNGMLYVLG